MAYFFVEKTEGYTVMANHHLRDMRLSLKARGLLSQILSLSPKWDKSIEGLAKINRECSDTIANIIKELEAAGYIDNIEPSKIIMKNGDKIPLSRNSKQSVTDKFISFLTVRC